MFYGGIIIIVIANDGETVVAYFKQVILGQLCTKMHVLFAYFQKIKVGLSNHQSLCLRAPTDNF
jgi:hypothetical protein